MANGLIVGRSGSYVGQDFVGEAAATPTVLGDDSDGWWAGANSLAISIPIVALAALVSTSVLAREIHQKTEDFVVPPQVSAEYASGSPFTDRLSAPTEFLKWSQAEDWVPQASVSSDAASFAAFTQRARSTSVFFKWSAGDDLLGVQVVLDDDPWSVFQPPLLKAQPLYLPDPESLPPPGVPVEFDWQVYVPPLEKAQRLYLPDPEEIPAGSLYGVLDDCYEYKFTVVLPSTQRLYLPDPEELPAASLYGVPDDGYWHRLEAVRSAVVLQPVTVADDIVAQIGYSAEYASGSPFVDWTAPDTAFQKWAALDELPQVVALESDHWQVFVPELQRAQPLYLPDPDSFQAHEVPNDDYWQQPFAVVTTALQVWAIADEFVPQPVALGVDEAYWQQPFSVVVTSLQVWTVDDEIVPQGTPTGSEFAAGTPFGQRARGSRLVIEWAATDDLPVAATPFGLDEEYWHRFVVLPYRPVLQAVCADNETVPQPASLSVDEAYWQRPFAIAVTFVKAWTVDDEIVPQPITYAAEYASGSPFTDWIPSNIAFHQWPRTDETFVPPPPPPLDEVYFWQRPFSVVVPPQHAWLRSALYDYPWVPPHVTVYCVHTSVEPALDIRFMVERNPLELAFQVDELLSITFMVEKSPLQIEFTVESTMEIQATVKTC